MTKLFVEKDRIFFGRWLRNPLRTGAIMPSGASLARLVAREVDPKDGGTVVELGGGTGVITKALLARGLAPHRLVVIERDEVFQRILAQQFPDAFVLRDDARNLQARLRQLNLGPLSAVVSGLPVLCMPRRQHRSILEQAFAMLRWDGIFVQFTYGPDCPFSRHVLDRLGLRSELAGRSWRNLPPASVYRFYRSDVPMGDAAGYDGAVA